VPECARTGAVAAYGTFAGYASPGKPQTRTDHDHHVEGIARRVRLCNQTAKPYVQHDMKRACGAVLLLSVIATCGTAGASAHAQALSGSHTGITCSIGGADVTRTGARDAAVSLYSYYITARRQGASAPAVIARLLEGGPTSGSSYLQQVRYAFARQELTHDPVTCATNGVSDVAVGTPRIVAGRTVGVIMASAHRVRVVVTIVLSAKGWTVGDIACQRRSVATAAR